MAPLRIPDKRGGKRGRALETWCVGKRPGAWRTIAADAADRIPWLWIDAYVPAPDRNILRRRGGGVESRKRPHRPVGGLEARVLASEDPRVTQ